MRESSRLIKSTSRHWARAHSSRVDGAATVSSAGSRRCRPGCGSAGAAGFAARREAASAAASWAGPRANALIAADARLTRRTGHGVTAAALQRSEAVF
jgi:hypothetical protein